MYSSVLPAAMLASKELGQWVLIVGAIVSLPFAPLGFIAFWSAISISPLFAFFATWAVNFVQGWLMLVQYVGGMKRKNRSPKLLKRFFLSIMSAIFIILLACGAFSVIT